MLPTQPEHVFVYNIGIAVIDTMALPRTPVQQSLIVNALLFTANHK